MSDRIRLYASLRSIINTALTVDSQLLMVLESKDSNDDEKLSQYLVHLSQHCPVEFKLL